MSGRLAGRRALITGASRGIGAGIAKRFAQEGCNLILTATSVEGLEKTDDMCQEYGVETTLVPLNLNELDKIDQMALHVADRFKGLDILVGNAGVLGQLAPVPHIEPDIWDETVRINVTANWRLIRAFDPMLRKSEAGRGIFVTSGAADMIAPYWSAYSGSKIMLNTMVQIYAAEIANTYPNMKVNLVSPGCVRTDMRASAAPGEDPMTLPTPEEISDVFVDLAADDCSRNGEIVRIQTARKAS
ncbi:MAG: SDR family NAD(P)-dependent oxidoreductase [Alphaproteobacteria bacterium]